MDRLERSLTRTAHRHADAAQCALRRVPRDRRAQPGARRHSSICRSRAASRGATMRFRRPAPSRASWSPRKRYDLDKLRAGRAERDRGHHGAGQPLGRASTSSRCRCCPTCSPSRRRASRAPRRPGSSMRDGFVTEGSSTQRLDRDARRRRRHPPGRLRHPARHHARPSCSRSSPSKGSSSRSAPSPSRRPTRRARPSSPRRRSSSCRWCASTAARSATARRGSSRSALRRDYHDHAEIA